MPIRPAEINIFPEDLLEIPTGFLGVSEGFQEVSGDLLEVPDSLLEASGGVLDDGPSGSSDRCWRVIYTKARQEKALARDLLQFEVPFYLPLVPKDNLIRGRRIRSHIPVFVGYLFLFSSDEERIQALTTNRVSRTLEVEDQEQLFKDLAQLRQLIATDAPLTIERRLMPGRRVRVKSGAMAGLEGTVISRRGHSRLLVAVNFLQRGASVAIEDYMLEPID